MTAKLPAGLDRFETYRSGGLCALKCKACGERFFDWHRLDLDVVVLRAVDHQLNVCMGRVIKAPAAAGSKP